MLVDHLQVLTSRSPVVFLDHGPHSPPFCPLRQGTSAHRENPLGAARTPDVRRSSSTTAEQLALF
jgi:hypothetical protein